MALMATSLPKDEVLPKVIEDLYIWLEHAPFSHNMRSTNCLLANLSARKCEVLTYLPGPEGPHPPQDELAQSLDSTWFSTVPPVVNKAFTFCTVERAEYVAATLASVRELWVLGIPPETCIMFLEDRLRNVYIRSLSLLKNLKLIPPPARLSFHEAAEQIGCGTSPSDLHLFVAIVQGILSPTEFTISTRKEQGLWWIMLETVREPTPIPNSIIGNDSNTLAS